MKVLFLSLVNDVKDDRRVRRSASTLAQAGHDVTVVGLKTWSTAESEELDGFRILRLPVGPFPLFPNEGMLRHVPLLVRTKPDVVHVREIYPLAMGTLLSSLSGARLVYESSEYWRMIGETYPSMAWVRAVERFSVPRCDLVIVQGDEVAEEMKACYGIRRVIAIRNIPEDAAPAERLSFRIAWPRDRALTFWGAIKEGRLLDETKRLMLKRTDLHIVFAGEGPMVSDFMDDPALAGRAHFQGSLRQEELFTLGRHVAVGLCLVDQYRGRPDLCLPNKLFEYLRSGVPVIVTDHPAMRKVVRETGAGIAVPLGDEKALEFAVDKVLGRLPHFRERADAAGRQYPWSGEASRLVAAYQELVACPMAR